LDHLASPDERTPVATVAAAAARVDARDVATFAGRLDDNATGFIAGKMVAQGRGGDVHDPAQLRHWASRIAGELGRLEDQGAAAARPRTDPA
jgi:menaquinone-dependent protoporphyrinogen oxidase